MAPQLHVPAACRPRRRLTPPPRAPRRSRVRADPTALGARWPGGAPSAAAAAAARRQPAAAAPPKPKPLVLLDAHRMDAFLLRRSTRALMGAPASPPWHHFPAEPVPCGPSTRAAPPPYAAGAPLAHAHAPPPGLRAAARALLQQVRARVSSTSGRDPGGGSDAARFGLTMNGPADIERLEASMGPPGSLPAGSPAAGDSGGAQKRGGAQPGGGDGSGGSSGGGGSGGGSSSGGMKPSLDAGALDGAAAGTAGGGGNASRDNGGGSSSSSSSGGSEGGSGGGSSSSGGGACDSAELSAAALLRCINAARQHPAGALQLPCKPPAGKDGGGGMAGAPAPTLAADDHLAAAAGKHAQFLAGSGARAPSNTGANGSSPMQRMQGEGFPGKQVAEAVASGQAQVREVVAQWLCSGEQREQVMVRRAGAWSA
jgi:hypothetical protein